MKSPHVSVIIPTRDSEAYLQEALASVYQQHYQDYEIIVVDAKAEGFRERVKTDPPCVRRLYQPPLGVAAARNMGLREAKGQFAAFLDCDDLWEVYHLETQIRALERYPDAILVFSDFRKFGKQYRVEESLPVRYRRPFQEWILRFRTESVSLSYGPIYSALLFGNVIPTSSVVLRKEEALKVGLFDEQLEIAEDYDYWLQLAAAGPVVYAHQILISYRVRDSGLTGPMDMRACRFADAHIRVFEKQLMRKNQGLAKEDERFLCERLAHVHCHLGVESLKTLKNMSLANQELSKALRMKRSVGLTFVQDYHGFWQRFLLLVKPYLLFTFTGLCRIFPVPFIFGSQRSPKWQPVTRERDPGAGI